MLLRHIFDHHREVPHEFKVCDQFIASFEEPPAWLTLDLDVFDDPTHGAQQRTLFHGDYDQYQKMSRIITCAENDMVVMVWLLHGTAAPDLGADDDLRYLVNPLRMAWPTVEIHLRMRVSIPSKGWFRWNCKRRM